MRCSPKCLYTMFLRKAVFLPLLLLVALIPTELVAQSTGADDESEMERLVQVDLRGGYTGTLWSPKGLGTYEVESYGRNMLYAELSIKHPFLIINEALDFIQIPRLRIESNMGYSQQYGSFRELIPETVRNSPYLRTDSWLTFFRFFSFRYQDEKFDAKLVDQRIWLYDEDRDAESYIRNVTNRLRDLEIGIIGSVDGEVHETMLEVGYYQSLMHWPIVQPESDSQSGNERRYFLEQKDLRLSGIYFALNTEPIEHVWPLYSQFMVKLGQLFGVDARFRFERTVLPWWRLGVSLDASWRMLEMGYDKQGELIKFEEQGLEEPSETRYRLTLFTSFRLHG